MWNLHFTAFSSHSVHFSPSHLHYSHCKDESVHTLNVFSNTLPFNIAMYSLHLTYPYISLSHFDGHLASQLISLSKPYLLSTLILQSKGADGGEVMLTKTTLLYFCALLASVQHRKTRTTALGQKK